MLLHIMNDKNLSDIKWATMVPLIGGSAIGCSKTLGTKPEYHLSYKAFVFNEKHILNYWKDIPMFRIDDEEFDASQLPETEIDMVNAVCPCAGLSMLSHSSSPDSKMNDWLYRSAEFILSTIKPKVFWGENAPALATSKGRPVALHLAEIGRKHGYSFSMIKTNAEEHGLPQNRQRTFYFFWKSAMAPIIGYHHRKGLTFEEHLANIPKDATQQDCYLNRQNIDKNLEYIFIREQTGLEYEEIIHKFKKGTLCGLVLQLAGTTKFMEWLSTQEESKQRDTLLRKYKHIKHKFSIGKGIMDHSYQFWTTRINAFVGAKLHMTLHPNEKRFLNIREQMHIMGLPNDFELLNWKNNGNCICQNVPTLTTQDFVKECVRFIKRDKHMMLSAGNFVVQNNCNKCIEESKMFWK